MREERDVSEWDLSNQQSVVSAFLSADGRRRRTCCSNTCENDFFHIQKQDTPKWVEARSSAIGFLGRGCSIRTFVSFLVTGTLTSGNDSVMGIWDTTAGSSSSPSSIGVSSGQYLLGQGPQLAFDRSVATEYVNYGDCSSLWGFSSTECGQNTGLYILLGRGASILLGFRYRTADNNAELDPISVTIEGSNNTAYALPSGSSWTLIYSGTSGLDQDPGRSSAGEMQWLSSNSFSYSSYRLLVLGKRGVGNVVQYAEIELFGYWTSLNHLFYSYLLSFWKNNRTCQQLRRWKCFLIEVSRESTCCPRDYLWRTLWYLQHCNAFDRSDEFERNVHVIDHYWPNNAVDDRSIWEDQWTEW